MSMCNKVNWDPPEYFYPANNDDCDEPAQRGPWHWLRRFLHLPSFKSVRELVDMNFGSLRYQVDQLRDQLTDMAQEQEMCRQHLIDCENSREFWRNEVVQLRREMDDAKVTIAALRQLHEEAVSEYWMQNVGCPF